MSPIRSTGVLLLVLAAPPRPDAWAQDDPKPERSDAATRIEAMRLVDENRQLDALPLLEELAPRHPEDRGVQEALAIALVHRAAVVPEEEQPAVVLRARSILRKLKETGKLSAFGELLCEVLPEDGKLPLGDRDDAAGKALREGESFFVQHQFDRAREAYGRALALDPGDATAALFLGDCYYAEGRMDEAIRWFEKAAQLDPDRESAHRYWGDALSKQGKLDEAHDKYLDAVVAAPYSRTAWTPIFAWAKDLDVEIGHPNVFPPLEDVKKGGDDGAELILAYQAVHEIWEDDPERFRKAHPDEAEYRRSLEEARTGFRAVLALLGEAVAKGEVKRAHPALARLKKLDEEGLLEPFILFATGDEDVAKDYDAYREGHRAELKRYLVEYVAPSRKPREP
jgi:tetratricopeptide (TPR) repeat protein